MFCGCRHLIKRCVHLRAPRRRRRTTPRLPSSSATVPRSASVPARGRQTQPPPRALARAAPQGFALAAVAPSAARRAAPRLRQLRAPSASAARGTSGATPPGISVVTGACIAPASVVARSSDSWSCASVSCLTSRIEQQGEPALLPSFPTGSAQRGGGSPPQRGGGLRPFLARRSTIDRLGGQRSGFLVSPSVHNTLRRVVSIKHRVVRSALSVVNISCGPPAHLAANRTQFYVHRDRAEAVFAFVRFLAILLRSQPQINKSINRMPCRQPKAHHTHSMCACVSVHACMRACTDRKPLAPSHHHMYVDWGNFTIGCLLYDYSIVCV